MWSIIKKFLIAFVLLGGVFGAIIFVKFKQFAGGPPPSFPPESVTTATAESMIWEQVIPAFGGLQPDKGAHLAGELPGIVTAVHFESGEKVSEGELLVELDVSVERAQLAAAKASAELAQLSLERARDLRRKLTISQADLDQAEAEAKETAANVASLQATVQRKLIRAPFSGVLGIRRLEPGEYLSSGQRIATLQALDTLNLEFTLPQNKLGQVTVGQSLRLSVDAFPSEAFEGTVSAIDPEVEETTRSFRIEGLIPNPQERLRPGMFTRIEVLLPEVLEVVAIPSTAIYRRSFGDSVFVVEPSENGQGQSVSERFVRIGPRKGDFTAILEGVEPGENVVTSGLFKLSNGRAVVVDNEKSLEFSLSPEPTDS
jgi:membrane fusion protein, multidrug efflux system